MSVQSGSGTHFGKFYHHELHGRGHDEISATMVGRACHMRSFGQRHGQYRAVAKVMDAISVDCMADIRPIGNRRHYQRDFES